MIVMISTSPLCPGTLWNLSSHDSVKMEIVDHALHALADEVVVPHSGWEKGTSGGEESIKPRHLEWEVSLTNTAGCLRYGRGRRKYQINENNGENKKSCTCVNFSPLCPTEM